MYSLPSTMVSADSPIEPGFSHNDLRYHGHETRNLESRGDRKHARVRHRRASLVLRPHRIPSQFCAEIQHHGRDVDGSTSQQSVRVEMSAENVHQMGPRTARTLPISRARAAEPHDHSIPSWTDPLTLHTDASLIVGAGVVLTQAICSKEFIMALMSHQSSIPDSSHGPTERKRVAVLYAISHFRRYFAVHRFTLVTYCSAFRWRFRSWYLSPKLHRWALRLLDYDVRLTWRKRTYRYIPDALSHRWGSDTTQTYRTLRPRQYLVVEAARFRRSARMCH